MNDQRPEALFFLRTMTFTPGQVLHIPKCEKCEGRAFRIVNGKDDWHVAFVCIDCGTEQQVEW